MRLNKEQDSQMMYKCWPCYIICLCLHIHIYLFIRRNNNCGLIIALGMYIKEQRMSALRKIIIILSILLVLTSCRVQTVSLEERLIEKTAKVFNNMQNLNWAELATYVHEDKGLTFSFYANFGSPDSYEVTFTKAEVSSLREENNTFILGYDNGDNAFEYTPNEYVIELLLKGYFSKEVLDYSVISFNEPYRISAGIINTIHDYNPQAVYIEYFAPAPEGDDDKFHHWQALRFVYEEHGKEWHLVAIVRDIFNP